MLRSSSCFWSLTLLVRRYGLDMSNTDFFTDPAAWRDWLERNHDRRDKIWGGLHKKAAQQPSITWSQAVDEALCYGWIDGIRRSIDDRSWQIRFTPRRAGSRWSAKNVAQMRELITSGRVREPGQVAFDARRPDDTDGYSLDKATPAKLPRAEQARFEANEDAWAYFVAQPPGYRNTTLLWVMSAKREDTRRRRLDTLIAKSANASRIKWM